MDIRAKFKVDSIQVHGEENTTIRLRAVYSDDPNHENAKYWKYTPSGDLTMTVVSSVVKDFKEGQEYYITLELAESKPHE